MTKRCEHGVPESVDCEQCVWDQTVADAQASGDDGADWVFADAWDVP